MAYTKIYRWLDWSIMADGSNDNSGAFVNGSYSGTWGVDRTTTADPYVHIGDGTVTASTATGTNRTKITLTNHDVSADDCGNTVNITAAGSGVVLGLYFIDAVDPTANTWFFSEDVRDSTGDSTPIAITTARMGGSWADLGFFGEKVMENVWAYAGQAMACYIKAGTYTMTSSSVNVEGGAFKFGAYAPTPVMGYTTERGDARDGGSLPLIDAASTGFTGKMIEIPSASPCEVNDIILDGGSTATYGIYGDGSARYHVCKNVTVRDLDATSGWGFYYPVTMLFCTVQGGCNGFGHATCAINCSAEDCPGIGYKQASRYAGYGNVAYGCGVGFDNTAGYGPYCNCIADDCTTGFKNHQSNFFQCIATNCTTGFSSPSSEYYSAQFDCVGWNNTTSVHGNVQVNEAFTELDADPWEDAASHDYRLNDTAGGGQVLRGRGYGFPGQTALVDTNAFITERSGGGSSVAIPATPVQVGM